MLVFIGTTAVILDMPDIYQGIKNIRQLVKTMKSQPQPEESIAMPNPIQVTPF